VDHHDNGDRANHADGPPSFLTVFNPIEVDRVKRVYLNELRVLEGDAMLR